MLEISLKNEFGPFCNSWTNGKKLHTKVKINLDKNRKVILNFANVKVVTSSFIQAAIVPLFEEYPVSKLSENLHLKGLSDLTKHSINLALKARSHSETAA